MLEASKTFVVECYVPGVDDAAVRRAADRAGAAVRGFREATGTADSELDYLGALLMAVDEVVLHAFRATDPELVRRISAAAGLSFARIVESVEVLPEPLIQPTPRPAEAPIGQVPMSLLQPKEVPS
jgi:hypothetical protein